MSKQRPESGRLLVMGQAGFEAARRDHRGYHGHSFRLRLRLPAEEGGTSVAWAAELAGSLAAPLDHTLVNDTLRSADDVSLLEHFSERLEGCGAGAERLTLFSGPHHGAWTERNRVRTWLRSRFEAAHQLPNVPEGHPCGRMHGHGFEVILECAGEDLATLRQRWEPLRQQLDGRCLNDLLDNPTSELLAQWIWEALADRVPSLSRVRVHETERSGCGFDGARYAIWKDARFEAATRLRATSPQEARGLHGHGYRIRMHLEAPLDSVLGWTVDYGDVKAAFAPVDARLDHQRLDRLEGLEEGTSAALAHWIWGDLEQRLPGLCRLDVHEQEGCGVILRR